MKRNIYKHYIKMELYFILFFWVAAIILCHYFENIIDPNLKILNANLIFYIISFFFTIMITLIFNNNTSLFSKNISNSNTQIIKLDIKIFLMYLMLISIQFISKTDIQYEFDFLIKFIIINIFFVCIVEEFTFRKVILALLMKLNFKYALILSSIIFMLFHVFVYLLFNNEIIWIVLLIKIISTCLLGIVLGFVFIKFNSLLLCILIHCGQNIISNFITNPILDIILYAMGFLIVIILCIKERRAKHIEKSNLYYNKGEKK